MQAAAPFAERRVRLCEQPWDARDARKVDVAAGAAPCGAGFGEGRVAARAGEKIAQRVARGCCGRYGRFVAQGFESWPGLARRARAPLTLSESRATKKNNGYPAIRGRVTVVARTVRGTEDSVCAWKSSDDRSERDEPVEQRGVAQTMVREQRRELTLLAVQRHVIQEHHVDEQVDVVCAGRAGAHHVAVGRERAELLMLRGGQALAREQLRATASRGRVVDEEE